MITCICKIQPRFPRDHIVNFLRCNTVKTCACLIQGKIFGGIIEIYHACKWYFPKKYLFRDRIYNYLYNQFLSPLKLWVRISFMTRCARFNVMWFVSDWWQVASIDKSDCHDITEMLLKVALNTINLNPRIEQALCKLSLFMSVSMKMYMYLKFYIILINIRYVLCPYDEELNPIVCSFIGVWKVDRSIVCMKRGSASYKTVHLSTFLQPYKTEIIVCRY